MKNFNKFLNTFITIGFKPKQSIQYVLDRNKQSLNDVLVALWLISFLLYVSINNSPESRSLGVIIGRSIISGIVLTPFVLFLFSFLIHRVGKLFGGQATRQDIRSVVAWSQAPLVYLLLLWPVIIIIFDKDIFIEKTTSYSSLLEYPELYLGFLFCNFVMWLWSVIIFIITLGQAQKVSLIKSIFITILFNLLLMAIPILLYFGFNMFFR